MCFPLRGFKEIDVTDEMEMAFGIRPIEAYLGVDLLCVFENENFVREMKPDLSIVKDLPGRIQNVTSKGIDVDCVSRSFGPKLSIDEDPVCGSAHCQIANYWFSKLNKQNIVAYQASRRGGYLYCSILDNDRIIISGEAVLDNVMDIVEE